MISDKRSINIQNNDDYGMREEGKENVYESCAVSEKMVTGMIETGSDKVMQLVSQMVVKRDNRDDGSRLYRHV